MGSTVQAYSIGIIVRGKSFTTRYTTLSNDHVNHLSIHLNSFLPSLLNAETRGNHRELAIYSAQFSSHRPHRQYYSRATFGSAGDTTHRNEPQGCSGKSRLSPGPSLAHVRYHAVTVHTVIRPAPIFHSLKPQKPAGSFVNVCVCGGA
jgi:hypothetical protein